MSCVVGAFALGFCWTLDASVSRSGAEPAEFVRPEAKIPIITPDGQV